jgi:RimJ/RimL family protein N-acetyltransferase
MTDLNLNAFQSKIIVETERLILREVSNDDFSFLLQLFNDPDAMKYYGNKRDEKQTREWIQYSHRNYEKFGFGKWIVVKKSDLLPIGHCGLLSLKIDGSEEIELDYFLHPSYWRQGYATEAAKAVLALGFNRFECKRIVSAIAPLNQPSVAVAKRLGMKMEKTGSASAGENTWSADVYVIEG